MTSKMTIIIVTLFLSVCSLNAKAQTTPKGKAQLIEFTNTTSKYIVPAGKTWYINQIFSNYRIEDDETTERTAIFIKSLNGIELTNLSLGKYGPKVFGAFNEFVIQFPLIFPENTKFELVITNDKRTGLILSDKKAILNYLEIDN
jgi:hypothetical protein